MSTDTPPDTATDTDPPAWDDIPADDKRELASLAATLAEQDVSTEDVLGAAAREDGLGVRDLLELGFTRREAMLVLAGVASGLTLWEAVQQSVGTASAGTNQAGTVGTASEPVDVHAEDVSAVSIDTEQVSKIRIVGPNGFSSVQAAHDDLPAEGGRILVTHDVAETGIVINKEVRLEGSTSGGRYPTTAPESAVIIDASGGDGIVVDTGGRQSVFADLHLRGDKTAGTVGFDADNDGAGELTLRNVVAEQFEDGFHLPDANLSHLYIWAINNARDGVQTIAQRSGDFFTAVTGQINALDNGRDGWRADYSGGSDCDGNTLSLYLENNGGYGANLLGSSYRHNIFTGYGTEANTSGGVDLGGGFGNLFFCKLRESTQNLPINNPTFGASIKNFNDIGIRESGGAVGAESGIARIGFDANDTDGNGNPNPYIQYADGTTTYISTSTNAK
jgi:hypothetical protein